MNPKRRFQPLLVGAGEALRSAHALAQEHDARRARAQQAEESVAATMSARAAAETELRALEPRLADLRAAQQHLGRARRGYERYLQHAQLAGEADARATQVTEAEIKVREATATAVETAAESGKLHALADPEARAATHAARDVAIAHVTELDTRAESLRARVDERRGELAQLAAVEQRMAGERAGAARATELRARTEFMRGVLREAGPLVAETLLADVSDAADEIFGEVLGDRAGRLRWTADYDIVLERGGHDRGFAQLSGGEQMTAALAVRLALLRELLHLDIAFFDEPTQNLDDVRRANLAEQILRVRGFEQLVVITHDDTFERVLDNVIHVRKVGGESVVEST